MGKLAKDIDPVMRETRDVAPNQFGKFAAQTIATIKSKTPYGSKTLKPKTDVFGNDMHWGEPLFGMHSISPGMARPLQNDENAPYVRELVVHKVGEGKPSSVVRYETSYGPLTVDLLEIELEGADGSALFYEYRQFVGEQRLEMVKATVQSKFYASLPDGSDERSALLHSAMTKGKSNGKELFLKNHKDLIEAGFAIIDSKGIPATVIPAGIPDTEATP